MKRILSLVTIAVIAASSYAQVPQIHPNEAFAGVSPNGKYATSVVYEVLTITDLTDNKKYEYVEEYYVGNGNAISNTGVVVGSNVEGIAQYWKDGEWHVIESAASRNMSKADGITPDGTRIVGAIAPEGYDGGYDGLMLTPCYWDVQADGTLSDVNFLPFPATDWSGRLPQYVTALRVSDDGKTIGGQIQDYSGIVCQPIVYRQDEDGNWTYTLIHNELYHPEGVELPEYPGEWDGETPMHETFMTEEEQAAYQAALDAHVYPTSPEIEDFMSEESRAAYQAALEKYYETWADEDYPVVSDYITEEEQAAFDAAMEAYNQALNDYYENMPNPEDYMTAEEKAAYEQAMKDYSNWEDNYQAWQEAFYQLAESLPNMGFNNVLLSHDGKTYATSRAQGDFFSGYTYTPYVFNLEDDTFKAYDTDGMSVIVSSMANDGTLLAQKPASWVDPIAEAYILPAGSEEFMPLYDYFETANPDLAEWMKENMTHEITEYEYDWETGEMIPAFTYKVLASGIPFTNADMSVIVLGVENTWDFETDPNISYGYVLYTGLTTGVNAVNLPDNNKVEYYTIDGRKVNTPAKGLNIVKTANGETKKIVVK